MLNRLLQNLSKDTSLLAAYGTGVGLAVGSAATYIATKAPDVSSAGAAMITADFNIAGSTLILGSGLFMRHRHTSFRASPVVRGLLFSTVFSSAVVFGMSKLDETIAEQRAQGFYETAPLNVKTASPDVCVMPMNGPRPASSVCAP